MASFLPKTRGVVTILILWTLMLLIYFTWSRDKYYQSNRTGSYDTSQSEITKPTECYMRQRYARVKRVCEQNPDWREDIFEGDNTSKLSNLWVNENHKIVYCAAPKTRSATFRYMFAMRDLSEMVNDALKSRSRVNEQTFLLEHGIRPMNTYSVQESQYRLENYDTIILLSHPFSRLLSAYEDDMSPDGPYAKKYVKVLNANFAGQTANSRLSLEQFIKLIVKSSEFSDPHWNQYYSMCYPCSIDYNHILKVETSDKDYGIITKYVHGSAENVLELPGFKDGDLTKNPAPTDTNTLFLKQPEILVNKLMSFYRKDFDLFGYDWNFVDGSVCGDRYGCGPNVTCT